MTNFWPSSDVTRPVYIDVLENAWGFFGATDQTGYQVVYMGEPQGLFTSYEAAAWEASRLYGEHSRRTASNATLNHKP